MCVLSSLLPYYCVNLWLNMRKPSTISTNTWLAVWSVSFKNACGSLRQASTWVIMASMWRASSARRGTHQNAFKVFVSFLPLLQIQWNLFKWNLNFLRKYISNLRGHISLLSNCLKPLLSTGTAESSWIKNRDSSWRTWLLLFFLQIWYVSHRSL